MGRKRRTPIVLKPLGRLAGDARLEGPFGAVGNDNAVLWQDSGVLSSASFRARSAKAMAQRLKLKPADAKELLDGFAAELANTKQQVDAAGDGNIGKGLQPGSLTRSRRKGRSRNQRRIRRSSLS
ncbi:MAG: hypothetical protein FJ312_10600 [SAR202 cluster bacterium]|nr:hypothetical protein [SAR202 cluster bacterium]